MVKEGRAEERSVSPICRQRLFAQRVLFSRADDFRVDRVAEAAVHPPRVIDEVEAGGSSPFALQTLATRSRSRLARGRL